MAGKIKFILATMVIIAILIGGVFINYTLSKYPAKEIYERFGVDDYTLPPEDQVDSSALPQIQLPPKGEMLKDSAIVNILLVGCDTALGSKSRSDSMMIATIDMKHKKLKLISLLRDMYVEIPGRDKNGKLYGKQKLNAAYFYGNVTLLKETIEHNFNISIDKYAAVDFALFKKIVDRMGGIDINLSADEAAYLRGRTESEAGPNRKKVKEGMNHVDGPIALEFARSRYSGIFTYTDSDGNTVTVNNDFARTARQRYVLETIFLKVKDQSFNTLYAMAEDSLESINTDITILEVPVYIESVLSLGISKLDQLQIPLKGTFDAPKNPAVLIINSQENITKNIDAIRKFIYEE